MTQILHCPNSMLRVTTEMLEFLPEPQMDGAKQLYHVWTEVQRDGVVYLRDLPSRAMAPFLQNIIVWESVDHWKDARVRLMGSGLHFRFGGETKGRLMSELFSHIEKPQHLNLLSSALQQDSPTFVRSHMKCGHIELMTLELFIAPIRDVGGTAILGMVCVLPSYQRP